MQKHLTLLLLGFMAFSIAGIPNEGFAQSIARLSPATQSFKITGRVTDHNNNQPLAGVTIRIRGKGSNSGTITNIDGRFEMLIDTTTVVDVMYIGYKTKTLTLRKGRSRSSYMIQLDPVNTSLQEDVVVNAMIVPEAPKTVAGSPVVNAYMKSASPAFYGSRAPQFNTEDYSPVNENRFHTVASDPLSTFSIDVDRASYSNVRRFLNEGNMPPVDAVRVEEMINYFDYKYSNPTGNTPVAVRTDMAICPWNTAHQLVRIALKGKDVAKDNLPPSNLVFLIDVSGSMSDAKKLPLVKQAFKLLVNQLRPVDRVAIVVYAGAAGLVLPSTSGDHKTAILDALDKLEAGGSTAGGEGVQLAYKTATEYLLKSGNNRVIIATDGDFNVGPSSDGELQRIIEKKREKGIFLSVLGFGMGNYKDNKLELLADKGNGNYAYIDNFEEARRTFATEFGGTLFTIAKDVKLQVEFNPKYVQSYRLVGYENRLLNNEDFNDDKKDAGDMGAGHTVTALYEVVPVGVQTGQPAVDPLKYQQNQPVSGDNTEVLTVKLRYKNPADTSSQLISQVLHWKRQDISAAPEDFRMATAVADFGLLLRNSEHKGNASYEQVLKLAGNARGTDEEGYRAEFIQLVKKAQLISNNHGTK
ncbi:vWA domain-containing protein [Chitinophaga pinensis]|uniref:von Willebrand factor type A n=1 Tax=Chitinophaga pinensis (strain ATCC 43595 / DSM 2588 / LMG 13176 / NBRC 15968 / NCIMB 11800 / UQM 2034) TaxID=485918 RepID=A0A979G0S3_CHIPD|nr:VWA domain-containing protein [Chitinophaga pinensis]ACU58694.1 von Willebrand factor type A [Chitinophaga pinensis DSM 2588]